MLTFSACLIRNVLICYVLWSCQANAQSAGGLALHVSCAYTLQCFAATLGLLTAIPQCLMSCNLAMFCRCTAGDVIDNRDAQSAQSMSSGSVCITLMSSVWSCIVLSSVTARGKLKDMHHGLRIHHAQTHVQSLTLKTDESSSCAVFWLLPTCDCNAFRGEMQRNRMCGAHPFNVITAWFRREHPCSESSFPTRADALRSAWGHSLSTLRSIGVMGRCDVPL